MNERLHGQHAAIVGKPPSDNPYEIGTPAHAEWLRGHNEITSLRRRK